MQNNNLDDVDDYMSDTIMNIIDDIRPGVVSKTVAKRYKIENEQSLNNLRNKKQKLSQIEKETRDEALSKPISSDNIGFAMMSKMGYKPGMTLGKKTKDSVDDSTKISDDLNLASPSTSKALKEPISVDLKLDRKGLGHLAKSKEKLAQLDAIRKVVQMNQKIIHQDYESRKRDNAESKVINKNLFDSQKVCFELDSRLGLIKPHVSYYWPNYANELDSDEDSEADDLEELADQVSPAEKLSSITTYLRLTHFYCVWCGIKYEDENDLSSTCPGDSKEAHDSEDLSNDF